MATINKSELEYFTREEHDAALAKYGERWMWLWCMRVGCEAGLRAGFRDLWRSRVMWFMLGALVGIWLARFVYEVTH